MPTQGQKISKKTTLYGKSDECLIYQHISIGFRIMGEVPGKQLHVLLCTGHYHQRHLIIFSPCLHRTLLPIEPACCAGDRLLLETLCTSDHHIPYVQPNHIFKSPSLPLFLSLSPHLSHRPSLPHPRRQLRIVKSRLRIMRRRLPISTAHLTRHWRSTGQIRAAVTAVEDDLHGPLGWRCGGED